MGCNQKPALKTNIRTPCLGFLSEEHLISLSILIKNPLQINLTECKECKNGFIVNSLTKRLENIKNNISGSISERIRLVENKTNLDYRERVVSRRDLFKGLGIYSARETTSLFKNAVSDDINQAYSDKVVPFKKMLLNETLLALNEDIKKRTLENYYYDLHIEGNCNGCSACVGICPTGALKYDNQETNKKLLFISARCSGCGLCASFCRLNAVNVKSGFTGDDPFEFTSVQKFKVDV
jgi:ferredoxin